jgi:hypothetical protein
MRLTAIDGVEEEEAEKLRSNDINYAEDLAGARCKDVEDIGLDSQLVAAALRHVGYGATFVDSDEIGYVCQHCGEKFAGIQFRSHDRHVRYQCPERPEADGMEFEEEVTS